MTTKYSFEVPIPHLRDFEPYQDYTFMLSFLLGNKKYKAYLWKKLYGEGSIYIDNSYNELRVPQECTQMIDIFKEYSPTKVVCPDSNTWSTDQVEEAACRMLYEVPAEKLMILYKNMDEWKMLNRLDIPQLSRACSYDWRKKFSPEFMFPGSHFLGLLDIEEVTKYKPPTLDTSMPIKLALIGMTIDEWRDKGYPHIHTHQDENFFTRVLKPKVLDLSIKNILDLKEITKWQNSEI